MSARKPDAQMRLRNAIPLDYVMDAHKQLII